MIARKIPWLRRQHVYSDEDFAALFACDQCAKEIQVEEHDRNLIGPFVYCDGCHAELMADYGVWMEQDKAERARLIEAFDLVSVHLGEQHEIAKGNHQLATQALHNAPKGQVRERSKDADAKYNDMMNLGYALGVLAHYRHKLTKED